jgi:hypothetical protein
MLAGQQKRGLISPPFVAAVLNLSLHEVGSRGCLGSGRS